VDVLWARAPVLKDWETMIELLVTPPPDIVLLPSEQSLLAKLLNACVKRANDKLFIPRMRSDPHYSDKEKTITENSIALTSCLVKTLPKAFEQVSIRLRNSNCFIGNSQIF